MTSGGPPAWGLGEGLTTPHCKKNMLVTKCYTGPCLDFDVFFEMT